MKTSTFRRKLLAAGLAAFALAGAAAPAAAQEAYPAKPIRVVVPYTPGGVSDAVTRLVMQRLAERLKTPIVVDNQSGANGQIGSAAVARAAPDGYTLLVVVAAHAINPSLYPKMSYSPLQDLRGVSEIGAIPLLMVSSAALPPADLKSFVAWARANPQNATFASSGAGSGAHLVAEQFAQTAGVAMTHVPYKGIAPALPDLFAGQVSIIFDSVQTMMPHIKSGKLRGLAMTSAKRWPAAPEVPTMAEAGFPSMTGGSWIGLLAPSKTPDEIVNKLSAEMQNVLQTPEVHAKLIDYGIDPVGGTPEQFDAFIQSEARRWAAVVKKADIRLD
ncbi:tripartite tricarboxylate transporter substrate binding protein [Variovorax saccharolyticus]|uniref:tripartite tricarboxylate transporter substrate binding protein n=1 Tax=Variovorax saccharolyticus TaxID=3053516 RepID=UPI002576A8AA|nr:tripartite tricarboxylate transporter substrate binding protein [Variovorax sp. J31P216]MDM0024334.1 tripartite tricarboxylate transporter substrate binding protein [Variovorax sp. J31P216]